MMILQPDAGDAGIKRAKGDWAGFDVRGLG